MTRWLVTINYEIEYPDSVGEVLLWYVELGPAQREIECWNDGMPENVVVTARER